jgi:DNA-binding beta-propeller fold protein YncE
MKSPIILALFMSLFSSAVLAQTTANNSAVQGTFKVGEFPVGMASDGTNIWVANAASNNVMKLRPSDGAVLGTFAVGTKPAFVAFDGANIWVALPKQAESGVIVSLA